MKRIPALMCAFFCVLFAVPLRAFAVGEQAPPVVTADAYIVMDADSGQLLIEKNSTARRYPASITKIMTLALALQKCGGDTSQQVTVSYGAVHALEYGASHVALQPDEIVTLKDLLYATILASANDAANVLAEYTAGSMEAFAQQMNEQAAALGMTGTHFTNANGLHNDNHYTTARDMAILTRWAMSVPGFAELFGATEYDMPPTNKQSEVRHWGTDNCMLVENKYQYDGTTGGKSGWTQEAGYTMVETVTRNERSLICVVLQSEKKYSKFADCIALCDYCYDNFTSVTIPAQEFPPPGVPLYGGDTEKDALGIAAVRPVCTEYTIWLHTALSAQDVTAAFELPERARVDEPFTGTAVLSLTAAAAARGCMAAGPLGIYPLEIDENSREALLAENEKEFIDRRPVASTFARGATGIAAGAAVCAALLTVAGGGYAAMNRAHKRKRRAVQRAEAAAPYTLHRKTPMRMPRPSPPMNVKRPAGSLSQPESEPRRSRPAHAAAGRHTAPKKPLLHRYVPAHARQKGKEERV